MTKRTSKKTPPRALTHELAAATGGFDIAGFPDALETLVRKSLCDNEAITEMTIAY